MQDIDHRCLEDKANDILTAIVHGMKKEEPSNHVRLAATNALFNSLEFTRANFEREVCEWLPGLIYSIFMYGSTYSSNYEI